MPMYMCRCGVREQEKTVTILLYHTCTVDSFHISLSLLSFLLSHSLPLSELSGVVSPTELGQSERSVGEKVETLETSAQKGNNLESHEN